jgi:hypothetical protein
MDKLNKKKVQYELQLQTIKDKQDKTISKLK